MLKGKLDFDGDVLSNLFKTKSSLIGVDISSSSVKMVELADAGRARSGWTATPSSRYPRMRWSTATS
jgi:hypothetical protein